MKPYPGGGLTAGLLAEAEQAKADKPDLLTLARLLAAHRGGDDTAAKQLAHTLRFVPYDFFVRFRPTGRKIAAEDVLATLWGEYLDAIRRLREGPEARLIPPERVEAAIRADLRHAKTHYAAEISRHILAKDSTNAERAKRGDDPYPDLQRVPEMPSRNDRPDQDNDDNDDGGGNPSRLEAACDACNYDYRDDDTEELLVDLDAVTEGEVEKEIMWYLQQRKSRKEIADLLGTTTYRVKQILNRIRARL